MKRLLLLVGIFILATVLFGGALGVQKSFAFEADFVVDPAPDDVPDFAPIVDPDTALGNADPDKIVGRSEVDKKAESDTKCSSIFDASISDCIDAGVAWFIKNTLLMYSGWILWLAATMMNYSIDLGVLQFSRWATDSLYPIWTIIRQIVSLFVIFAGLYLGFMYILGKENTFEKYIPWVIIFALFVNFSYPIVRTAVDISNVISLNIYTSAIGSGALDSKVEPEKTAGAIIRSRLGLSGMIDFTTGNTGGGTSALNKINSAPAALLAVIFVMYAAYIFFMVTILMALRTAALVILIVASPLLLIDSVIPKLGEISVKMRKILFEQLALAPVFTIMLALTLKFLDVFQTGGPLSGTNVAGVSGGISGTAMFFNMLMMLIMLHIMLKVTKSVSGSMGTYVSNAVGTVGSFATSAAIGAATGGTGLLARASIGRAAAAVRDSGWMERKQDSFVGRRMYDMSNSVAKSSFDLRNSSVLAGGAQALGLSTKGMGAGVKGGYEEALSKKIEDRKARYGRIKTINNDGTINEKGIEAKQRFFESQGTGGNLLTKSLGITTTKEKIGSALLEDDRAVAIKDNDSINRYNKLDPEKRQAYFKAEKDPNLQKQFLKIDEAAAEKFDKERPLSYSKTTPHETLTLDTSNPKGREFETIPFTSQNEKESTLSLENNSQIEERLRAQPQTTQPQNTTSSLSFEKTLSSQDRGASTNTDKTSSSDTYSKTLSMKDRTSPVTSQKEASQAGESSRQESQRGAKDDTWNQSLSEQNTSSQSSQGSTINRDNSTTVGDTTITSTTVNNMTVNGTPAGYTQNSGGVVLVPTNMKPSRPSLSGLSGVGGVDIPDQQTFNRSTLTLNEDLGRMPTEEEIDSIVKTLLPMNEESRKKALESLNFSSGVANRILSDPRLKDQHHNAMTDDAMDILV